MGEFNRRLDKAKKKKINKLGDSKKKNYPEYNMDRQIENTEEKGLNKLKS